MYEVEIITLASKRSKWIEVPLEEDGINIEAQKLLSTPYPVKGDSWRLGGHKGYTIFDPEEYDYEPHHVINLVNLSREYGLIAELFAQKYGVRDLYFHFENCVWGMYDNLKEFAEWAFEIEEFKQLVSNSDLYKSSDRPIEVFALDLIEILNLTVFMIAGYIFVFEGINPPDLDFEIEEVKSYYLGENKNV